ncbi:TrfB-related DNA-binding protein [Acinetobacter soli]|uniref:TrfB-related DNA-binding protein n=1 Tax=Acinetobacter soli TaxID=487316 RepID=UPI00125D8549|nr:TrfB-related DNA-binding protein [Acinetobacter soli]
MSGKTKYPYAITAEQWDDLLPFLSTMQEKTLSYCKEVLVDGYSVTEVAVKHGLQRQVVNKSVSKVYVLFNKRNSDKKDWVSVTVFVPKTIAQEILEIEKREKQLVGLNNSM